VTAEGLAVHRGDDREAKRPARVGPLPDPAILLLERDPHFLDLRPQPANGDRAGERVVLEVLEVVRERGVPPAKLLHPVHLRVGTRLVREQPRERPTCPQAGQVRRPQVDPQ